MGRPHPRAVLELAEGGETRGRSSLRMLKSFCFLVEVGADTKDSKLPSEGQFPRENGQRLCSAQSSGAESQILILSGISPSEEDLGTEPHRTTWTLGARRRLSLHAACPLPHLARPPHLCRIPQARF